MPGAGHTRDDGVAEMPKIAGMARYSRRMTWYAAAQILYKLHAGMTVLVLPVSVQCKGTLKISRGQEI
jgi:hypothetical protein